MNHFDIVGDIHGCASTLVKLLEKLGYQRDQEGIYSHQDRRVVFLGDFIDRGPFQREVIDIVRKMIKAGNAVSVMGNHEYNALAFATRRDELTSQGRGEYLRQHSQKNIKQHIAFLNAYADQEYNQETNFEIWYESIYRNISYQSDISWFKTLPLWLDLGSLRVIHACWDKTFIDRIQNPQITEDLLKASSVKGCWQYEAIETILKGKEIPLPEGQSFRDKDGNERHNIRVRWWDQEVNSYQQAFLGPESARTHIPDDEIEGDHLIDYGHDEPPVFLGHYWMEGKPEPLASNIACTDFSVAKPGGKLVAYRWDGESSLSVEKFVALERVE